MMVELVFDWKIWLGILLFCVVVLLLLSWYERVMLYGKRKRTRWYTQSQVDEIVEYVEMMKLASECGKREDAGRILQKIYDLSNQQKKQNEQKSG